MMGAVTDDSPSAGLLGDTQSVMATSLQSLGKYQSRLEELGQACPHFIAWLHAIVLLRQLSLRLSADTVARRAPARRTRSQDFCSPKTRSVIGRVGTKAFLFASHPQDLTVFARLRSHAFGTRFLSHSCPHPSGPYSGTLFLSPSSLPPGASLVECHLRGGKEHSVEVCRAEQDHLPVLLAVLGHVTPSPTPASRTCALP